MCIRDRTGLDISGEQDLMSCMRELAAVRREYERLKGALDEVEATGYGIVMPSLDELSLEEPEIMRQGGRYGVRLRASAPSIHMMKANITTEAVSYTHLDVYKRQGLDALVASLVRSRVARGLCRQGKETL